jgi:hypothetical protein
VAQATLDFSGTTVFVTSGINLGIAAGGARVAVMSRSPQKVDAAAGAARAGDRLGRPFGDRSHR